MGPLGDANRFMCCEEDVACAAEAVFSDCCFN
jgi:hypothetical protein